MSLYYEAAAVLANTEGAGGSLKSRIYRKRELKSSPGQIFALIAEASKWSSILKGVVEKCGLLADERKLTPVLVILLSHDLLLAKGGVAAPPNHVLRLAITRHKARLSAEFTKARLRLGFPTLDALKEAVNNNEFDQEDDASTNMTQHPRWVRINTILSTLKDQLAKSFADYSPVQTIKEVLHASGGSRIYYEDEHIPSLLAFPPKTDLSKHSAYVNGQLIFQDKASCFPAYLLDPSPEVGDIIDGCAAPGNKTTHLAAIISSQACIDPSQKVIAFERDKGRSLILQKLVKLAAAEDIVKIEAYSDFLAANPESDEFAGVGAILLDPSCSGTGIVGRDDTIKMHLPTVQNDKQGSKIQPKGKKRKRTEDADAVNTDAVLKVDLNDSTPEETAMGGASPDRLKALSIFQLHILTHAMRFPSARRITYSTCSVHFEENEGVVFQALASPIARERGWKILRREEQVQGMKKWHRRGTWEDTPMDLNLTAETKEDVLDGCIRCDKGTEDGTMGFFVAGFVREDTALSLEGTSGSEIEWNGFSDGE